jgi:hypothetical protein
MMIEVAVPGPTEHPFRSALLICGVIILLITLGVLLKTERSSAGGVVERLPFATLQLRLTVVP